MFIYAVFKPFTSGYIKSKVDATNLHAIDPLPDIGHVVLPNMAQFHYIGDIIVYLLGTMTIVYCLPDIMANLLHDNRVLDIAAIFAMGLIVKLVMTCVTILPDSSQTCAEKSRLTMGSCNDLLPSGHMMLAFTICIVLWPMLQNDKAWLAMFVLLTVLLLIITIASRNHYTIDTIASLFIVIAIHSVYVK
jgi:hypothetical protein